ncbi:3' terminal RNA ribose 2'-O-methyltransferase Hen1 [Tundrisphaera sp. TA3]|uniref:3' terminal RNA ribose 2'-O-methyltransferase Hen1 n=1 Tax=Tundrisphaera sp. TA3 TaxID=3435775 RepID=UPI003EC0F210
MLLTISTVAAEATDLGYLLHKHPDRLYERDLGFGVARVFFPEAGATRCTAALAVEVDAVGLARGSMRDDGYVTDRPYVAGSLLSVAMGRTFRSALAGRTPERPDRVDEAMPLEATLSAVHSPGGEAAIRRAFESLGYEVECRWQPVDPRFPEWGDPRVATVTLRGTKTVRDLLRHIYILAPVVDGSKHYHVGLDEVDKLIRHGSGWLADHPHKDWVVRRYLRFKAALARKALSALVVEQAEADVAAEAEEETLETPVRLNDQRHAAVLAALRDPEAAIRSVVDLGCGEGKMLIDLARDARFDRILGIDVSGQALERAETRIERQHLPAHRRGALTLAQGSLVYRDDRLRGFDAATLVEVIEHVDPGRLPALARAVFGHARPRRVVVTTPNAEYNVTWESLPAGKFRHRDHRFEWTRAEFRDWAARVAGDHGYAVRFLPVGPVDEAVGSPTQMALFDREARA